MRISKTIFISTLAFVTLNANACILNITDGETSDSTGDTTVTASGTASADAGDGDGDGDGDSGSESGETGTTSETGGDGDGDGDCEPYGDPGPENLDCCEEEVPLSIVDGDDNPIIEGIFCSPPCGGDEMIECPTVEGFDAQCVLGPVGSDAENCAILCDYTGDGTDCPSGSTCKDLMQGGTTGICTYP